MRELWNKQIPYAYDGLTNLALLVARVVLIVQMIPNGLRKLATFEQVALGMGGAPQVINGREFPGHQEPLFYFPFPEFFLAASLSFDILAAVLIIVGLKTRMVALLFAGYCLLAMLIYHSDIQTPQDVQAIMRNLPLFAGLFFLVGVGAGRWSLDGWLSGGSSQAR